MLALLVATYSSAQERRFARMTTADGLPQNSVECFAQDSAGFIWIGTQDGLVRYDGYEMLVFRSDPEDSTSLSDNFITALFIDSDGELWVGTRNGINHFDKTQNGFVKFFADAQKRHQSVRNIYEARDSIWFIIEAIPFSISKGSNWKWINELGKRPDNSGRLGSGTLALHFSKSDQLIELSIDEVMIHDKGSVSQIQLPKSSAEIEVSNSMMVQGSEKLWIICHGLFALNLNTQTIESYAILSSDSIRYLNSITYENGKLWIGTELGLFVLNESDPTAVLEHFTHDPDDPFSINYDFVHTVFRDREQRLWVGTANKGLAVHDPQWQKLQYLKRKSDNSQLPHPLVWCSYLSPKGELWVGTADGLVIFSDFDPEQRVKSKAETPSALRGLSAVRDIIQDRGGTFWIASGRGGLQSYDPISGSRTDWPNISKDMVSLAEGHRGGIWAASYSGLFYKAPAANSFERMDQRLETSAYCMSVEAFDTEVIVTHSYGVDRVEVKENGELELRKLRFKPGDASGLPFSICSSALPVSEGLFAGMYDRGVAFANEEMKVVQTLNEKSGLAGHVIESLIKDARGRIWISTNQGLSCYQPETKTVTNFTAASGLRNQEFAMHASMQDVRGWLYFGTVDGLLYFHPDSLLAATGSDKNHIALTSLNVNYKDYRSSEASFAKTPLQALKSLELAPEDKVLSLRFSAMNFAKAAELKYAYRMQGFDKEWVETGPEQRLASYTSLPAGDYTFQVRATFADGTPAARDFTLPVSVLPPFYETWWFRFLVLFGVVSLIVIGVRFLAHRSYQRQLRELETKQRIQQERERISRDLHDNVGSQITYMISSLDNLSYQSNKGGNSETSDEINELGDFARGTMQQLREAIWVINKSEVTLEEFRLKLEEYCQKLLKGEGLPYWNVECSGDQEHKLPPGAVLHLFRICQESIHNTVKHAEANQISIKMKASQGKVTLSIKDDGKGFDPDLRKEGHYGLDNMKERASQMEAEIQWIAAPGNGTEVLVTLDAL